VPEPLLAPLAGWVAGLRLDALGERTRAAHDGDAISLDLPAR